MEKKIGMALLVCLAMAVSNFGGNAIAYHDYGYPYNTTTGCVDDNCTGDDLDFYQNNCTSYVAYVLHEVYGLPFRNDGWSHGGNWASVAESRGIKVDKYPIPGDVAWWDYDWTGNLKNKGDDYGHVAFVEKVHYNSDGNATGIEVSEYNYSPECRFSHRSEDGKKIKVGASDYPTAFIHILAFFEGVTMHYLDCYEMQCQGQTAEEWEWIVNRVWNEYRCKNCNSDSYYDIAYVNSIASGFGGGWINPEDSSDTESGDGQEITGDYGKVEMSAPNKSKKKPELYVKELKFKDEKTKYYDDENITVYGYAKNVGKDVSKKITKIRFKLYRFKGEKENGDAKEVGDENIKGENLKSGKTKEEEFKFGAPDDESVYQFYAIIDAKDAVDEANDKNNRLGNIRCRVHKRPDIEVSQISLNNGETQFEQGTIFKARATFENDGGEPFKDVPVRWYLNGVHIADDNIRHWNIEKGDEKHEEIKIDTLSLCVGIHNIKVKADCEDDRNKNDNEKEISFEVIGISPVGNSVLIINPDTIVNSSCEYFEVTKIFQDDGTADIQVNFIPELADKIRVVGQTAPNDYWDNLPVNNGELYFLNWPVDASPEFSAYYEENGEKKWLVAKACSEYFNNNPDPQSQHFVIYSTLEETPVDNNQYAPIDCCQYFTLQKTKDLYGKVDYQIIFSESIPDNLGFVGQSAPNDTWMIYSVSSRTVSITDWPKGEVIEFSVWYFDETGTRQWLIAKLCPEFFNGHPDPNHQHFKVALE